MKASILSTLLLSLTSAAKSSDGYSYQSLNVIDFPQADLNSLYRSSGLFRDAKSATFGAISGAEKQIATPVRSIDSLFLRLPSSNQLDELVASADSVALLKTIQVVATDDSLPCDQRISYLLEVLGRIKCAIEKKQFHADQVEVIIKGAQQEIKRLQRQIDRLQDEKKSLWLDELRDELDKLIRELENVYHEFNYTEGKIPEKQGLIAGYEKEIDILRKSSDEERNRIAQDVLKLTETEAIIRDLERQLDLAHDRKAYLQTSIQRSRQVIKQNDEKIEEARQKIQKLEEQIRKLRDKVDSLRSQYTDLEIKVERLRTDISVAEAKEDKINAQIDHLTNRINLQKKKLAEDELHDLNRMIQRLKMLVPTTEKEIDRHYYDCYGEGAVQISKTGSVVVYIVKGEMFGEYLHNAYGKSVKVPALRGDVHFERVDIFSAPWTSKYGLPYPYGQEYDGTFHCLNPSATVKGQGKIDEIKSDAIHLKGSDGKKVKLNLGSCSRIQAVTSIPAVGQNIYYSAEPSSAGGYNLYQASCF